MKSENENYKFITILRTFSQVDVAVIKSLLDGNVEYYFKDENFMSVRPLLEPSVLMVREDYVEEVRELLKDFELNYMGVSLKNDLKDDDLLTNGKDENTP
jgi:hypothetical protein